MPPLPVSSPVVTPSLDQLARLIDIAHGASERALRQSVWHAVEAGRLLLAAKARLPHGAWRGWLAANVSCSERSAQVYMSLARAWPGLDAANAQHAADFSLRDALRSLADPGETDPEAGGADEWYTPPALVAAARGLLGGIDLDPCSCAAAQAIINAGAIYDKADDGLSRLWFGRVWLNPPYGYPLVERFTGKLIAEDDAGRVARAVVLVNAATDAAWFVALAERYPLLFTRGRVRFWRPGRSADVPRFGSALFGVGVEPTAFAEAFAPWAYAPNQ